MHLVPKREDLGYMWSYIWTIELTSSETDEFLSGITQNRPVAELHLAVHRIIRSATQRGQPFGPGTLDDYDILDEKTAVRFVLRA